MSEPTHRQYKILKKAYEEGSISVDNNVSGLDDRWELVRAGYLKNYIGVLSGAITLRITDKGTDYIESQED